MWLCAPLLLFLSHFFHKRKQNNKVGVECLLFSMPPTLCTVIGAGGSLGPAPWLLGFFSANHSSVDDFVDCGLLVSRAGNDELVVRGDITAENRRRLLRLDRQRGRHISYKQSMNHVFVQIVTQKFKCWLLFNSKQMYMCPKITL